MKKYLFILVLFVGFVFADSGKVLKEGLDMGQIFGDDIRNVDLKFCPGKDSPEKDGSGRYIIYLRPGEKIIPCFQFTNKFTSSTEINYGLVDATLSSSGFGYSCLNSLSGNVVSGLFDSEKLGLSGQSYHNVDLGFVAITGGVQHNCIVYYIANPKPMATGQVFFLRVRKPFPISFMVTGDVYNPTILDEISDLYRDQGQNFWKFVAGIIAIMLAYEIVKSFKKKNK